MGLDITVIFLYLIIIIIIGLRYSGAGSITDYFLGNRSLHWMIACFSIVATETSTLTFLSIPGLAYISGTGFLQIALGYIIGRILVALILIPKYFEGEMETVYHFLQRTFNAFSRRAIAVIFHCTRLLADSVRLFATAIPLSILMGWDISFSLLVIGAATMVYTLYGGIRSVVIVDTIQFFLYLLCVFIGIGIIVNELGSGFADVFSRIPFSDLQFISSGLNEGNLFNSYNIISGIAGGALLSFGSHGTDHIIVQRVLSCRDVKSAQKAMIMSGLLVFAQFALFLLFGLFIRELLNGKIFTDGDVIVPYFIVNYLPAGVRGLMLAGIFASAMSTLSSSINSLSASTLFDILDIGKWNSVEKRKVLISRLTALIWSSILIMCSMFFRESNDPLVEIGLAIASITYGSIIAIFLTGRFMKRLRPFSVLAGVFTSIGIMAYIALFTSLFWVWYVGIGFVISLLVSLLVQVLLDRVVPLINRFGKAT